jgi:hypothetical protein
LVKQEISRRYYQHYLNIINKPGDQAPPEAPPPPEEAVPAATAEPAEKPAEPAPADEDLAAIPEVAPIRLKLPPIEETAAPTGEKKGPEKKGLKKFCFIATAAYGSPLAREVVLLQDFRDQHLAQHAFGEKFIQAYYRVSPPFAGQISKSKALKLLTRFLLTPVIFLIKKSFGK